MQPGRLGALAQRRWLVVLASTILSIMFLAGCGGSTDQGVDLGRGHLLAFIGGDGNLWVARGDGSSAHAITTTPCPASVNCYGPPSWSPDGQRIAVFGPQSNAQGNVIYFFDRRGILQKSFVAPGLGETFGPLPIVWTTDGKSIAYRGTLTAKAQSTTASQNAIILVNASSGSMTSNLPLPAASDVQCPGTAAGGPLGSTVDRALNGSGDTPSTFDRSHDNGSFLISAPSCQPGILLLPGSGGNAQSLAPATVGAYMLQASFSPTGKQIAAVETAANQDDLVIYDATGSNPHVIYSDNGTALSFVGRLTAPTWSSDGKTVIFMHNADLWSIGTDGTNPHQLIAGTSSGNQLKDEAAPAPAPDGQALAWIEVSLNSADNIPRSTLYVGNANAANGQIVNEGGIWPAWSASV